MSHQRRGQEGDMKGIPDEETEEKHAGTERSANASMTKKRTNKRRRHMCRQGIGKSGKRFSWLEANTKALELFAHRDRNNRCNCPEKSETAKSQRLESRSRLPGSASGTCSPECPFVPLPGIPVVLILSPLNPFPPSDSQCPSLKHGSNLFPRLVVQVRSSSSRHHVRQQRRTFSPGFARPPLRACDAARM